jgi:hypothetical protein
VVKEVVIRLVTALIILLCVLSRIVAIPVYLQELGYIDMDPGNNVYFNMASKGLLYLSGIAGALIIFWHVITAYLKRRKLQSSLTFTPSPTEAGGKEGVETVRVHQ